MTLAINIRTVANGWLVEIWRGKNPKEEHVFIDGESARAFVQNLIGETAW